MKTLILYDPTCNVSTKTTYSELEAITGMSKSDLSGIKYRKRIISNIDCYIIDEKADVEVRRSLYENFKIEDEVWKSIEGSDGLFLISNYGRFKRIYKTVTNFLMPVLRKQNNHLYIRVRMNGIYKTYKISQLVAHHFLGSNKNNYSVRHKNGIKTDCFAGNLEYISRHKLGQLTGQLSRSKVVVMLDPETLEWMDEFRSVREAGRQTNLSYQAVLNNCNGKTDFVDGGRFKFVFLDDYEEEVL